MARYTSIPRRRSRASGLGPPPACEFAESLFELTVHVCLRLVGDPGFGHQDQVVAHYPDALPPPESLPQQPLHTVPGHRAADPPSHGKAQAHDIEAVAASDQQEEAPVDSGSTGEDPAVLRPGLESFPPLEPGARWGHSPLDREPLAALVPTPLEDQATALRPHSHQEAVRPLSLSVVRLERPLHSGDCLCRWLALRESFPLTLRENV